MNFVDDFFHVLVVSLRIRYKRQRNDSVNQINDTKERAEH